MISVFIINLYFNFSLTLSLSLHLHFQFQLFRHTWLSQKLFYRCICTTTCFVLAASLRLHSASPFCHHSPQGNPLNGKTLRSHSIRKVWVKHHNNNISGNWLHLGFHLLNRILNNTRWAWMHLDRASIEASNANPFAQSARAHTHKMVTDINSNCCRCALSITLIAYRFNGFFASSFYRSADWRCAGTAQMYFTQHYRIKWCSVPHSLSIWLGFSFSAAELVGQNEGNYSSIESIQCRTMYAIRNNGRGLVFSQVMCRASHPSLDGYCLYRSRMHVHRWSPWNFFSQRQIEFSSRRFFAVSSLSVHRAIYSIRTDNKNIHLVRCVRLCSIGLLWNTCGALHATGLT